MRVTKEILQAKVNNINKLANKEFYLYYANSGVKLLDRNGSSVLNTGCISKTKMLDLLDAFEKGIQLIML